MRKALAALMGLAIAAAGLWTASRANQSSPPSTAPPVAFTDPSPVATSVPPQPASPGDAAPAPASAEPADGLSVETVYVEVFDAQGQSASGVHVSLHAQSQEGPSETRLADAAETDARGMAVLSVPLDAAGVAMDRCFLVEAAHAGAFARERIWSGGLVLEHDVSLVLKPGGTLAGHVRTKQGEPVANAEVLPFPESVRNIALNQLEIPPAKTGPDGAFECAGLDAGRWQLYACAPGHAPRLGGPYELGRTDVELVLGIGGQVSGRVECAETRQPVEAVKVRLNRRSYPPANPAEPAPAEVVSQEETSTDASGSFRLSNIQPGDYVVSAGDSAWIGVAPHAEVTVAEGGQSPPVTLRVTAGATVSGRVYDAATGEGLAGAIITATPQSRLPLPADLSRTTTAGPDGRFTLKAVREGECRVYCNGGPGLPCLPPPNAFHGGKTVRVAPGERVEGIELPIDARGRIEGVVVDPEGRPVAGACVRAYAPDLDDSENNPALGLSGPDGTFRVCLGGTSRGIVLWARKGELSSTPTPPGPLGEKGVNGVVLSLAQAGGLCGRVVDKAAQPVPSARVYAVPSAAGVGPLDASVAFQSLDTGQFRGVEVNGIGRFRIRDLPPGPYDLFTASEERHATAPQQAAHVEVKPGETGPDLTLVWDGTVGGVLAGAVTFAGQPVSEVDVCAGDRRTKTGPDGRYRIEGVEPGDVRVTANLRDAEGGAHTAATQAVVAKDQTTSVDLELASGDGAVEGTVRLNGEPLHGLPWSAVSVGADGSERRQDGNTDAEGHYRLTGLATGSVRMVVGRQGPEAGFLRRITVEARAGETVQQDLEFTSGASIEGHVTGTPKDARVFVGLFRGDVAITEATPEALEALTQESIGRMYARADGSFTFGELEAGHYTVAVASFPVTVAPNQLLAHLDEVDLVMYPADVRPGEKTPLKVQIQ